MPDHASLSFVIRLVHVTGMAVLLGGAVLLWTTSRPSKWIEERALDHFLLIAASRYEYLFWGALGIMVMTGVGNLGALGAALPGESSTYGSRLIWKLIAVLALILLSLGRTLILVQLQAGTVELAHRNMRPIVRTAYALTSLLLGLILFLAVSLAHG